MVLDLSVLNCASLPLTGYAISRKSFLNSVHVLSPKQGVKLEGFVLTGSGFQTLRCSALPKCWSITLSPGMLYYTSNLTEHPQQCAGAHFVSCSETANLRKKLVKLQ